MSGYASVFETDEYVEVEFDQYEAIAAIGMVAAFADGDGSEIEAAALAGILCDVEFYQDYDAQEMEDILYPLAEIANESGLGVLLHTALRSLAPTLISNAFATATVLLIVDGEIHDAEAEFLALLQKSLGLSDEEAEAIIEGVIEGIEEAMEEEEEEEEEE